MCEHCVRRSLIIFWALLVATSLFYLGIASASLAYFGEFRHESFFFYKRVNIETLVVAVLGCVTGVFGAFGTRRVMRRVVFGADLSLLATFVLLLVATVSLRQMKNPFAEHDSSVATSEVMSNEIVEYVTHATQNGTAHNGNSSTPGKSAEDLLHFMNLGQRIFECCGKASYRDYQDAPIPSSCCVDPQHCPLSSRLPLARTFDTSTFYGTGCLYNMYNWVVLVTLAGLNLAVFCITASGCLLLSGVFLYLNRNKRTAALSSRSTRSSRTTRSLSHGSTGNLSMVVVVLDDRGDTQASIVV
ncbi:hypothetical protein FJT64_015086 [Amphibalanus amphitrite]|uniref:Tetraspanin n=1 Tax=Amphibalanus amphitrite TaxID=1232801 RepID=A0A6A4XHE0_AMPAM|nr:uncharacterized protein LOC122368337 [Amphibalanus amphitrite]XP_043231566.1 uncharacterized protein LOC122386448 [Amphibalanus amphitrite]KAF0314451.1 hypothetical protein FJT64_015086 [Amphibalanus amphitrite]